MKNDGKIQLKKDKNLNISAQNLKKKLRPSQKQQKKWAKIPKLKKIAQKIQNNKNFIFVIFRSYFPTEQKNTFK